MISPSVGRVVWFYRGDHEVVMVSDQPLAAIVTYVHSDTLVNLAVFGKEGQLWSRPSVTLLQDDAEAPARGSYAEWMPFQKGQAKRCEAETVDPDSSEAVKWPDPYSGQPSAEPALNVVHPSTRGPNKIASGPDMTGAGNLSGGYDPTLDNGQWNGDAPTGFEMVNPPIGPEYKPVAEHPMPNAPEPINKVPAESPANPDRPLD